MTWVLHVLKFVRPPALPEHQVPLLTVRAFILLFFTFPLFARSSQLNSVLDPAFAGIPFNQWLQDGNQSGFRWALHLSRAELSFHQRFTEAIEATIDGRDLEAHRSHAQLVFFVQVTDAAGALYQSHGSLDLDKLNDNVKATNIQFSQPAFFLPGDYRVAIAILDTATHEHSAHQTQLHIAAPHDFLNRAWRNLPPVEFIQKEDSPDSWYLPEIHGQLEWLASVHSPASLNVILNIATTIAAPGERAVPNNGLPALLPTLKAISQTGSPSVSENIELLDLSRRRAAFHQNDVGHLDWSSLKSSLAEANTASIDIHALSEQHHDAQFFVAAVRKALRSQQQPSVLLVLSTSVAFPAGEDLTPISLEAVPPSRVFYIRYHAPIPFVRPLDRRMGQRGMGRGSMPEIMQSHREIIDQLEPTLKPLRPKVFDVTTPDQITSALSEIEKALANL